MKIDLTKKEIELLVSLVARHLHELRRTLPHISDYSHSDVLLSEIELTDNLWDKFLIILDKEIWEE